MVGDKGMVPSFVLPSKFAVTHLFYAQNVSDLAFSHTQDKTSSKRQKMAIIPAIMVINGNSKMALNSRSI